MPLYDFQHPKTLEVKEIVFRMNDDKVYIDEDGVEWARLFSPPNPAFDTQVDPYSKKDFLASTANKKETYGDLLDRSKELSEKRKIKDGKDPVQSNWFKNWSKKRGGAKHPQDR